uniref:BHLH domain-containing protein n=1 Tax=Sinocyclocheilus rhinocerous TaxID=307959 RepID=A0A673I2V3_9TELE
MCANAHHEYQSLPFLFFSFLLDFLLLKKRDDFEDVLEERRRSSDLRYALRCYTPTLYKGLVPCKASMLKTIVLQSDHLQYVIKQVQKQHSASALYASLPLCSAKPSRDSSAAFVSMRRASRE